MREQNQAWGDDEVTPSHAESMLHIYLDKEKSQLAQFLAHLFIAKHISWRLTSNVPFEPSRVQSIWTEFMDTKSFHCFALTEGITIRAIIMIHQPRDSASNIWELGYLAFKPRTRDLLSHGFQLATNFAFGQLKATEVTAAVNRRNQPMRQALTEVFPEFTVAHTDDTHVFFRLSKASWDALRSITYDKSAKREPLC